MDAKDKEILREIITELTVSISKIENRLDDFIKDFHDMLEESMPEQKAIMEIDDGYQIMFSASIIKEMEKIIGEKPILMGLT